MKVHVHPTGVHPTSGHAKTWRRLNPNGYWYRVWWEGSGRAHRRQRYQPEHRWLWESRYGPIPLGYEVHHRDHDRANNDLRNLELRDATEHRAHHGQGQAPRLRVMQNARSQALRAQRDDQLARGVWRCSGCKLERPVDEFSPSHIARQAGGYCNACSREYMRRRGATRHASPGR